MPRAHLVQLDIAWEGREANHARARQLLAHAPVRQGDLVLLPEMFATGFSVNVAATADTDGRTLAYLGTLASDLQATVQGGRTTAAAPDGKARNVMSILVPDGEGARHVLDYAKVHPFPTEITATQPGEGAATYQWAGLTVMPAVCYDLRFPELFRLGLKAGSEVIALGACWPAVRQEHWRALLVARAIENQAWVLGCNRVGAEPGALGQRVEYRGGSIVLNPRGEVAGELGDAEGVLSIEIDPDAVRAWRRTFRAWRDLRLI
jgi:omega-amidase